MSLADIQAMKALKLAKRIIGVPYPQNFPWQPFNIYKIGKRQYANDLDIEKYRNSTGKTYYVSTSGSSSFDGLSWSTPLSGVGQALAKPDVDRIVVMGGLYDRLHGFNSVVPARNVSIIGIGKVILSNHDSSLTWSATTGQTNVWQTTRSSTANVFDASSLDSYGNYKKLTLQTSIANVSATAGSYYVDASNIVYVHTFDSRQPDSNIRVYVTTESNIASNNVTLYMENIRFEGGQNPFKCVGSGSTIATVIAKNCKFKYGSQAGNGCFANVGAISHVIDCIATGGEQDGFNYHANSGTLAYFTETDCQGFANGMQDDNDNGSTSHDGCIGVRVNGVYYNNKGPNVIDVNDNTTTYNVGVEAYDSLASATNNKVNFSTYGETATLSRMYLYDCYSHGSSTYDAKLDQYGHMFLKSTDLSIGSIYTATGDILDTF